MSWVNYDFVLEQLVDAGLDMAADSHKRPAEFAGRIQRWRVKGEDNEFRGWTKLREWRSPKTGGFSPGVFHELLLAEELGIPVTVHAPGDV